MSSVRNVEVSSRSRRALTVAGLTVGLLATAFVEAKDLYVSPSGSDSVAYASNTISAPWKTIEHGLYNLKAGDHLYIRGGNYTARYPVWLSTDYNRQTKGGDPNEKNNAQSGTASAPVIVENYQGESVTVDAAAMGDEYGSAWVYLDNINYWTFRGLNIVNSLMVFVVGEDYNTQHNTFDKLNVKANRGGDNAAAIHLWDQKADYTTITNCTIRGPGQNVHQNTGTIYIKGVNHLKVLNNVLSDAPIGIYFKHRNSATSASQADIEVAYNYISNTTRTSLEYNGSFTHIHDNIFGVNTTGAHFGDANGAAGADYNVIEHNTFSSGAIGFDSAVESGDPFPGVVGNTVVNNIFEAKLEVLLYTSAKNTNILDKNVYPSSSSIASYSNLVKAVASSLFGTPTYVGGSSPTTIAGFQLASGSVGKGAATDGKDMGADVTKFGSSSSSAPPTKAPNPPTGVTVQ